MKHCYIFDEPCNAARYGIGTYIHTIIRIFQKNNFRITVVELFSDSECVKQEIQEGVRFLYIPGYENKNMNRKYYYRNIFYVLHPYIDPTDDHIAHINYRNCRDLMLLLKHFFNFKIYLTWHFSSWREWMDEKELYAMIRKVKEQKALTEKEFAIHEDLEMERRLLDECCDKVIVLAEHARHSMQIIYGQPDAKLRLIHHGIEDFYHHTFCKTNIKQNWSLPAHEKIILFVGRLDENKNATILIQAFHQVKEKYGAVRLIIAGAGNFETPLSYIHPSDYTHITFTGFVDKERLHQLYTIADLGVIPSHYEELGYVATEMMMHGLPILANRTSGLTELMEEGVSGIFIDMYTDKNEQETVDLLADTLLRLLQDETLRQKLGKEARKRYLKNFNMDIFEQKMIAFYQ